MKSTSEYMHAQRMVEQMSKLLNRRAGKCAFKQARIARAGDLVSSREARVYQPTRQTDRPNDTRLNPLESIGRKRLWLSSNRQTDLQNQSEKQIHGYTRTQTLTEKINKK